MNIYFLITWLYNSIKGLRKFIFLNSFFGVLRVIFGLLFVWICKLMIDIATHTTEGSIAHYSIFLVASVMFELFFSIYSNRIENTCNIKLKNKLKLNLFSHIMISLSDSRKHFHSGDIINRLEEDVRLVSEALSQTIPLAIISLFQLIAAFLFLYFLNAKMSCIILVIMPLFLLFSKLYINRMTLLTNKIRTTDSQIQSLIQENIQNKILIQTLEKNNFVADKLSILQGRLYGQTIKRINFSLFSKALILSGFAITYIVAFIWGVNGIYEGILSFGVLTAFLQLVGQVQRPIVDLSQYYSSLSQTISSVERLKKIDEIPQEEQGKSISLKGKIGIRFCGVNFYYTKEKYLIKDFSYNIEPGSRISIVGKSGVGKTTTIHLILGLLYPQKGKVLLYNNEEKIPVSPLTRINIIYIPQGNTLFSGTIRENLLLGDPLASEDTLKKVLWIAAAEFVYDLLDGLNTFCGEKGSGLSEGQAQRICIARGLLRPGNILILDEFSSALDQTNEQLLVERLISNAQDKTIIFITHRELVTRYSDSILYLNKKTNTN